MEPIYQHDYLVNDAAVDCCGRLRLSMLLFYCQDIAGHHCDRLGADYHTLAQKNLFWAVIRQKVQITRLPRSGETIRVQTWPMPTTRTCYPRSTVAYDSEGRELFQAISLWVLMDVQTRAMILPGKSGINVTGLLTGNELSVPGSLSRHTLSSTATRHVAYSDLDRNGHMNNTRYLDWVDDLLPSAFHREHAATEFTICYHSEAREGNQLNLNWQVNDQSQLLVDGWRQSPEDGNFHRIFSAQVRY